MVNRLSRFTVSAADPDVADPASETVLLDNIPSAHYHNGGAIHFGPDGKLYVAVGDGAAPSQRAVARVAVREAAADRRATARSPPTTRSSAARAGVYRAIWALGLRNPFTFDIEAATGRMFINDVGQDTTEEIDAGRDRRAELRLAHDRGADEQPAPSRTPFYSYPHDPELRGHRRRVLRPGDRELPARRRRRLLLRRLLRGLDQAHRRHHEAGLDS